MQRASVVVAGSDLVCGHDGAADADELVDLADHARRREVAKQIMLRPT